MAAVLEVADVFRRHGEAFRQARTGQLGCVERRVMGAITACRTAALGGHLEQCDDCSSTRIAYNSCRNRHCPKCQGLARAEWLAHRQAELLPVPYFHVVFTLPTLAGQIAFQNKASGRTNRRHCSAPYLGPDPGSRTLTQDTGHYHLLDFQ